LDVPLDWGDASGLSANAFAGKGGGACRTERGAGAASVTCSAPGARPALEGGTDSTSPNSADSDSEEAVSDASALDDAVSDDTVSADTEASDMGGGGASGTGVNACGSG
jgi:hypothetical protein